ncbi:MAG TPA: Fe-S cluster assembly ATPase SufC [Acidimicrobiales bacterium]|nr:Fe-S cluster assembly ATPase SufC [Acidimicrobiales bacterium]
MSPVLKVSGLCAGVAGREILHGVDFEVRTGEVHAIMGPNGSGKSTLGHVLMGRPGYEVSAGSVSIDGQELLGRPVYERARAGLFLALQYPVEVPGVSLVEALEEAVFASGGRRELVGAAVAAEAGRIGLDQRTLGRSLNVDMSGGEKKRNETLQLAVLRPRFALLDEIDSGLDIDALRAVARRIEGATNESELGVVAITHYSRLLTELKPDVVHVLAHGRIAASGGPELAAELERTGYAAYGGDPD